MTGTSITVERPGALTTVQDAGRPGLAHLGVPRSGALDPAAHRLANRLAGNAETAPVLETTLTGVALRFAGPAAVAVTGAAAPVTLDGQPAGWGIPVPVRRGQVLDVGRATAGVRSYVAVSGGFAVPLALGSASTDLLSGLGPPRLAAGQILTAGDAIPASAGAPRLAEPQAPPQRAQPPPQRPQPSGHAELPARLGPRDAWLAPDGRATLTGATFTVALASNRIGLRLEGPPVRQAVSGELPSEGLVWGAVQLLPDGNLVIFLADHPTTGGYPVIAVVDPAGFTACAQAAPGTTLSFRMRPGPELTRDSHHEGERG
jgi:biotin-dependent carboxylase-like uncharacterized protein